MGASNWLKKKLLSKHDKAAPEEVMRSGESTIAPYMPGIPVENIEPEVKELREALSSLPNGPVAILVFGNSSALAVAAKAPADGSGSSDQKQAVALLFTWNPSFKINTRSTVVKTLDVSEGGEVQWKGLSHVVDDMCLDSHIRRGVCNASQLGEVLFNRCVPKWKELVLIDRYQALMVSWRTIQVASSQDWQEHVQKCLE